MCDSKILVAGEKPNRDIFGINIKEQELHFAHILTVKEKYLGTWVIAG